MYIIYTSFLGLEKGECTEENLRKAKSMVPKSLEKYVERTYSCVQHVLYIFICATYFIYQYTSLEKNMLNTIVIAELASGDLEKFIPVIAGPSTSMEELDIKLEGSRPPSSSHTSLSEDALSPPSQYFSEEEDEEEESDQDDQADSDLEVN